MKLLIRTQLPDCIIYGLEFRLFGAGMSNRIRGPYLSIENDQHVKIEYQVGGYLSNS